LPAPEGQPLERDFVLDQIHELLDLVVGEIGVPVHDSRPVPRVDLQREVDLFFFEPEAFAASRSAARKLGCAARLPAIPATSARAPQWQFGLTVNRAQSL
jgi:hypothetical protein